MAYGRLYLFQQWWEANDRAVGALLGSTGKRAQHLRYKNSEEKADGLALGFEHLELLWERSCVAWGSRRSCRPSGLGQ